MPRTLLGEQGNGLYDDLPYFLADLRPQGFLGRQIASQMAQLSADYPPDPALWSSEHVGRYLLSNGDDLPGNFKFGPLAHLRVRHSPAAVAPDDYPRLADEVMAGGIPGSSAGGEQPKFTAYNRERGHVIVKFSPPGDEPVARRWRDILVTEYHATEAIHAQAFPAAETRLFERGGRLFLESQRFDRRGEFGRLSMISLQAVDAEFTGLGAQWPIVMRALERMQLIHALHVHDAEFLWYFGRLINNSDMHLGNISLAFEGDVFRILPVYDMCSMGFAPKGGEVMPFNFYPPDLIQGDVLLDDVSRRLAERMAQGFWVAVAGDQRISAEFREFLRDVDLANAVVSG